MSCQKSGAGGWECEECPLDEYSLMSTGIATSFQGLGNNKESIRHQACTSTGTGMCQLLPSQQCALITSTALDYGCSNDIDSPITKLEINYSMALLAAAAAEIFSAAP